MTEPGNLLQLIRRVRAQRHATDALEGERLRLEVVSIEFVRTCSLIPFERIAICRVPLPASR